MDSGHSLPYGLIPCIMMTFFSRWSILTKKLIYLTVTQERIVERETVFMEMGDRCKMYVAEVSDRMLIRQSDDKPIIQYFTWKESQ